MYTLSANRLSLLALALLPLWSLAGAATVEVEFVAPEKYTDAIYGPQRPRPAESNGVFRQLRSYLEQQAPRHLAEDQLLRLRFTDIDLAGDREPTMNPDLHDVRIVRGVYPPRLQFDYELLDGNGTVLRHESVDLRDLAFDANPPPNSSDPLRYEKRMLRKWLQRTFASSTP